MFTKKRALVAAVLGIVAVGLLIPAAGGAQAQEAPNANRVVVVCSYTEMQE